MTAHPALAGLPARLADLTDNYNCQATMFDGRARRLASTGDYAAAADSAAASTDTAVLANEAGRIAALVDSGATPIAVLADMITAMAELTSGTTDSPTGALLGRHAHNRSLVAELAALYSVIAEHITGTETSR